LRCIYKHNFINLPQNNWVQTKVNTMNNTMQIHDNYLDIVFLNRNKSFGAYELRSNYNKRLRNALIITFLSMSLLCFYQMIIANDGNNSTISKINPPKKWDTTIIRLHPIKPSDPIKKVENNTAAKKLPNPTQPKPKAPKDVVTVVKDITPIKTPPVDIPIKPTIISNPNIPAGPVTTTPSQNLPTGPLNGGDGNGTKPTTTTSLPKPKQIVGESELDENPSFPGGDKAMQNFLDKNLEYPDEAIEVGAEADLKITFVLDENGKITQLQSDKNPGFQLKEEAFRVLRSMPKWTPGKIKGVPVKCYFTIPITFILDKK
jgi:protein TonB